MRESTGVVVVRWLGNVVLLMKDPRGPPPPKKSYDGVRAEASDSGSRKGSVGTLGERVSGV